MTTFAVCLLSCQALYVPWSVTCKTWRDVQMRRNGLSSSAMSAAIPSRQLPGTTAREELTSQVHPSMDLRIVKTGGLAFINSVAPTIWWSAYRAMNPTQEPTNVKPGTSCQQPASPCTWMSLVSCCEQWITCTCVVEPHSFIHPSIHPFIHSFIHPFIHSFIHSFFHSFIHSFIHPFIHSFKHITIHTPTYLLHPSIHLLLGDWFDLFTWPFRDILGRPIRSTAHCHRRREQNFYMCAFIASVALLS